MPIDPLSRRILDSSYTRTGFVVYSIIVDERKGLNDGCRLYAGAVNGHCTSCKLEILVDNTGDSLYRIMMCLLFI